MAELADSLLVDSDTRLDEAEAAVRGHCRWHVAPSKTMTATLDPSHSNILMLPSLHVTSITSIVVDGEEVSADSYNFDERGWVIRKYCRWSTGPVVVTFTHGFDAVPADLAGVVRSVAQRAIDGVSGLRSFSRADGPFSDSGTLDGGSEFWPNEIAVLSRYALPPRP